jgi:hypothetical protein
MVALPGEAVEEDAASAGRGRPPWLPTLAAMRCSQAAAHGSIPRTLPDCCRTRSDHPLSLSLSLSCSFSTTLSQLHMQCVAGGSRAIERVALQPTAQCSARLVFELFRRMCRVWFGGGLLQRVALRKGLRKGRHAKTRAHSIQLRVCLRWVRDSIIHVGLRACR